MILTTGKVVRFHLGGAVATTEIDWLSSWADHNASARAFTPNSAGGTSSGASDVTVVTAPSGSLQRHVKSLYWHNRDTAVVTVTVEVYDGTARRWYVAVLDPTWTLEWEAGGSWKVYDSNGRQRLETPAGGPGGGGVAIAGGAATATSGTVLFSNANGISFGLAGSVMTASGGGVGGGIAASASGSSASAGTVVWSNSNNVSFGMAGSTITASVTVPQITLSDSATSGALSRLAFTNLNGVTLTLSTGAGGSHTLVGSHNALTSQSNQAISGSNASSTFQTISFGNSNNVSHYLTNGSLVASFSTQQSTQPVAASGSNASSAFSTLSFGNSNNVSFYLTNGSLVASVSTQQSTQPVAASGSNASAAFSTLTFGNSNDLSFYFTNGSLVGSFSTQQSVQPVAASGSNSSAVFSTLTFGALNGASFYFSNGSVVLSYTVPPGQTSQSAIKAFGASNTGNTSGTTGVSTGIDWILAGGNNITISESTAAGGPNTLWISGANAGGAQTGISGLGASDATYTSGTVIFSNQNNVTIGTSLNGASQYIRLSVGNFRASTDAIGLATAQSNVTWTVNSSGLSLDARGYAGTGTSTQATAGASLTLSINSLGLSLGVPSWITTYAAQSNQQGSIYASSNTFGTSSGSYDARTLSIAGSGIASVAASNSGFVINVPSTQSRSVYASSNTFGTSSGTYNDGTLSIAGSGIVSIAASNSGFVVYAPSTQTRSIYASSNTFGTSSGTYNDGTLSIAGSGAVLVAASNSGFVISAPTQSVQTQSTVAILGSTGSISFANSNNVSFGGNASTITASASFAQSVQTYNVISASGNTSGTLATFTTGTLVFAGGNNITLSQSSNSITISGANAGGAQTGISGLGASNTTFSSGTVIFSNQANITIGTSVNGGSQYIRLSAGAGGGGAAIGVSNIGNTAGNTGTFSSGTIVLAGSSSLTLSQSTDANGATIYLQPAMSQLTAGALISLSTAGSTVTVIGLGAGTGTSATNASITLNTAGLAISVADPGGGAGYTALSFQNRQFGASTTINTPQNSLWMAPFRLPAPVSASTLLAALISFSGTITSATTAQHGGTLRAGIWSQNATASSRFDTLWTAGLSWTAWNSGTSSVSYRISDSAGSTTGSSAGSNLLTASFMGVRQMIVAPASVFPAGLYIYGFVMSSSTAGYGAHMSRIAPYFDNPASVGMGTIGQATDNSRGFADGGTYGTTTGGLPASLALSDIKCVANVMPWFKMGAI